MEMFYNVLELVFVFVEGVIVFSVPGSMCGKKYKNTKHIALIMAFSGLYTLLITYINTFTEHMMLVLLSALCCSFAVNFVISKASLLLRCTSIITTWFFLHALDYVLAYGFLFIGEKYNINEKYFTILNIASEVIKISILV